MIKDRFAGPAWALSLLLLGIGGYSLSGVPGLLIALGAYAAAIALAADIRDALVTFVRENKE
jgi:hypothetical protein